MTDKQTSDEIIINEHTVVGYVRKYYKESCSKLNDEYWLVEEIKDLYLPKKKTSEKDALGKIVWYSPPELFEGDHDFAELKKSLDFVCEPGEMQKNKNKLQDNEDFIEVTLCFLYRHKIREITLQVYKRDVGFSNSIAKKTKEKKKGDIYKKGEGDVLFSGLPENWLHKEKSIVFGRQDVKEDVDKWQIIEEDKRKLGNSKRHEPVYFANIIPAS